MSESRESMEELEARIKRMYELLDKLTAWIMDLEELVVCQVDPEELTEGSRDEEVYRQAMANYHTASIEKGIIEVEFEAEEDVDSPSKYSH